MSAQPIEIAMAHLEGANEQLDKRLGELNSTIESRFAQVDGRSRRSTGGSPKSTGASTNLGKRSTA
jgi:hypothetical protein